MLQEETVYDMSAGSRYQLLDNTVYSFLRTREGVCFFGYYRRGLHHNYARVPLFHAYRSGTFDSRGVNVRSMSIGDDVKVLGSRGGLYLVDERSGRHKFFTPEELGGSIVTNVVRYGDDYYCATFNGGVVRLSPRTLTVSRFGRSGALRWGSFGSIAVSPEDELWMAGNMGVYVYNRHTGAERSYTPANSPLPSGYVNNIVFDRQGRCWLSSAHGMALYDPVEHVVRREGFPAGFFNNVPETTGVLGDRDNLLFLSTDGLYRTDEDMTRYGPVDTRATIGNDYVSQVMYDARCRHYWVATERGMFRFDPTFRHVARYGASVGLDGREFSTGAIHIDRQRRLWTGTATGLYYASLDTLERYTGSRQTIMLSEATIGKRALTLTDRMALLHTREVSLAYNFGVEPLTFQPVVLDYSDVSDQCYEWRMDDGAWQVLKNGERVSAGSGVGFGHHTLELRVAGAAQTTTYALYVWPSAAFVCELAALLALAVAVTLAVRGRIAVKRGREALARMKAELEEVRQKYVRVTTSDVQQERIASAVAAYMEGKPYLNADLRLSDVAAAIGCSVVRLSQHFNMYMQTPYYDFINRLRLEEFKRRLNDRRYEHYTLLALAAECGFRRSAFFATFKKMEGMTPTEYVKSKNQRSPAR